MPECYYQKALHPTAAEVRATTSGVMHALLEYWSSIGGFATIVTKPASPTFRATSSSGMPLPCPPKADQRRIGGALRTWTT